MSQRERAVLLLSPGVIKHTDADFGLPHLVALGSFLQRRCEVRVEIVDLGYEGGDRGQLERLLDELGPYLLIGLSCYSSFDLLRVLSLARYLRERYPEAPLCVGGYHPSALPSDFVGEGLPFDYAIRGEGELPLATLCEALLGGDTPDPGVLAPEQVDDLDTLPPYDWELLARYWPRARQLGSKLQIYLSRGCVHHCTFCMERAKDSDDDPRADGPGGDGSGYRWRAFSAPRAIDELARLHQRARLSRWLVNVADPLFGWRRRWRREVLAGIIEGELLPRQYWTLTRIDDLDDEDVELLARARFAIGVGLESGDPSMLTTMQKTADPSGYLAAVERVAELARRHGLTWAANIIVGHPGETEASLRATHAFCQRLFCDSGDDTHGWLSVDPFRLYPGSAVQLQRERWEQRFGARFYHPRWWQSWYDGAFRAEHLDPSAELTFERRLALMFELYRPLMQRLGERFRGQGREIDRVFELSIDEQRSQLSPRHRDALLERATRAKTLVDEANGSPLPVPIGLQTKDPAARRREEAVRRLLESGALRDERLIEALLSVPAEPHLGEDGARAFYAGQLDRPEREGEAPRWLGIDVLALALEALELGPGQRVVDLLATASFRTRLLAAIVGDEGEVLAIEPSGSRRRAWALGRALRGVKPARAIRGRATSALGLDDAVDRLLLLGAVPCFPAELADRLAPEGRAVALVGPRFAAQELLRICRGDDGQDELDGDDRNEGKPPLVEQRIARLRAPVLAGPAGWLEVPRAWPRAGGGAR